MEAKATLCGTTLEVLDKDNYISWSVRVKTYLMSQDLWDVIDLAIESLKEEDDEAAWRVWSMKNFMALQVIQNSCGPKSFYEIRKIKSARTAWYKLAEICNDMLENTNSVVQEVLGDDNYEHWSAQVKSYLMAQDLWETVEATTKPPKQEDDESAFRTWSKNNFLALHVIQNSCGQPLFQQIKQMTLAKGAWDYLAETCDVRKRTKSVIRNVLKKDPSENDYDDWSIQITTYLKAQDLWDTMKSTIQPPKKEDGEVALRVWTKKNSMALQVIQNSCERDISNEIKGITLAKTAWDTLEEKYSRGGRSCRRSNYLPLIDTLIKGDPDKLHSLLANNMAALKAKVNDLGETPLHIAVAQGHAHIVEKLVDHMSQEDLEILDNSGMTAMACASALGDSRMLRCMHQKNEKLLTIRDRKGRVPLLVALEAGNIEVASSLYSVTPKQDLIEDAQKKCDSSIITALILSNKLDLALDLLQSCYRDTATLLATSLVQNNRLPLYTLACKSSAFPSGCQLVFWKKWIYSCMSIHDLSDEERQDHSTDEVSINARPNEDRGISIHDLSTDEVLINVGPNEDQGISIHDLSTDEVLINVGPNEDQDDEREYYSTGDPTDDDREHYSTGDPTDDEREYYPTNEVLININTQNEDRGRQVPMITELVLGLLRWLMSNQLLGIRHIYDMKVLHAQSRKLLELTCEGIDLDNDRIKAGISDIIFRATREGIIEIVREMLKVNPSLVRIKDEKSRSIFSLAVLCRQVTIWKLLNYELPIGKDQILFGPADGSGNNILHVAATVDTSTHLLHSTSAALQMQRELQWFKEIESLAPSMSEALNSENMRPKEIFTRDHKEMLKQGEKWMKGTATSCTVVGALIITIMFAVAFAVPGGNNQDTGLPMFSKDKLFMLFIISDALSLFSSTTSVLMFLRILTSRYAVEDYLKSLPQKMIIGLSALFFSIATMMMAFCVALLIMLPRKSLMVIPIICLASVPVGLFGVTQFSLLVDMIKSTYGRSIFARK